MSSRSKPSPVTRHRRRLAARGIVRVELKCRRSDVALLRRVADGLSTDGASAEHLRRALTGLTTGSDEVAGRLLAALRRSPLVEDEIALERETTAGRDLAL